MSDSVLEMMKLPQITRSFEYAKLADRLVDVQPMTVPGSLVYYMKYKYGHLAKERKLEFPRCPYV